MFLDLLDVLRSLAFLDLFLHNASNEIFAMKVLYGSTMQLLVHQIMPGGPEENLKIMWKGIRDQYDAQNITSRFGTMKMSMFNPKGGANLRILRN